MDYSVSIIIPNYNGETILKQNIPFVLEAYKNSINSIKEVIIVDDCSIDQSVQILRENFPEAKIIQHKVNRGFSSSVNTGVRGARGNLICLLNTDVIVTPRFLEHALPHFDDPKVFGVSLHEKGFGPAKGFFEDGFIVHKPVPEGNSAMRTFWVNGGSGVFRRSYWKQLGGMDEKLFSPFYWEDVDLSYRAQKRGWQTVWEPKSKVIHDHETTISKLPKGFRSRIQERNQLIFVWKNITSASLYRKHLSGLIKRLIRHPGYFRILFMAFKRLRSINRARRKEIRESRVSDEVILSRFSTR